MQWTRGEGCRGVTSRCDMETRGRVKSLTVSDIHNATVLVQALNDAGFSARVR